MYDYLLQISIGPVQEFIASARRTRDLWFGSMMLSELAKAAALSVMNSGGSLIFPNAEKKEDLAPLNVANVILAEFEGEHDFREIARLAREAAVNRLKVFAEGTFKRMNGWIDWTRWNSQLNDIVEFYSAWTPINGNYSEARHNVARLLAARKNIRDFQPNPCPAPVPKSSLDGLRESVFRRRLNEADIANIEAITGDIRIKRGESLDAIGLIKRVPGEDKERFESVSAVALDPDQEGEHYSMSASYIAFICADGDRMGAALDKLESDEAHRKFSSALSRFALEASTIVTGNDGQCIYTGGDDVLAFLPLNTALKCARELHDKFGEIMSEYKQASLSVGLSIAHAKEDLSLLLQWGREAESAAKKGIDGHAKDRKEDRNGLAVSVRSRGSNGFTVREQWKRKGEGSALADMSIDERLLWFVDRFMDNQIPAKFPYELRENADFYDGWTTDKEALKRAISSDVIRIFQRKDVRLGTQKQRLNDYIVSKVHDAASMREFANELIAAQWICFGIKQANAKGGSTPA